MMRISALRRGIAAARPMSKGMQLSPAMTCRTIINLPNLPEDENINWSKELLSGFFKLLVFCTVYTGASNYVADSMEASAKANEEKMDAHYRAKFAAEAAAAKA
mmetsp:Transcript_30948/g.57689  ORF Transcript_30948/g.57689 Transcript_30948/m.57689 type:complete len:104 (+) Transcript_30948:42-353(+)|eukprot:CAMPEP_0114421258 /NCGR_PEP_ID=MMETSP0103-20121206/4983_1 /TAXON_ID=37642 ORGANISM="Paraphysomonas imperforata, Strain PA2" /NCGR_SAMPLE_ID=MMETSP0103 /ASSEMBLY_ACC=CAM_ASM_000201 /LENGTH=103 /DNA_ID=CAMNT_0001589769 /DNA_START=39 /DNA_END=350 /DNA_ORIENTATION=+